MAAELERLLRQLRAARLRPSDWARAGELLVAIENGDDRLGELSSVVFEGQVRGRFAGQRSSAGVEPTKQTSALPWVGLACGGSLIGVGMLLGGGVILVGVIVLGLFVFGVAMAGSRVAHQNVDEPVETSERAIPLPDDVRAQIAQLESRSA